MSRDFTFIRQACLVSVLLMGGVSACGGTDAYVYKAREFDRQDSNFNKQPTDRDDVTVCYNGIGTSDGQVAALAQAECGKFGKVAVQREDSFGSCPLLTPVQARFACHYAENAKMHGGEPEPRAE
jgi:hypothetical protein